MGLVGSVVGVLLCFAASCGANSTVPEPESPATVRARWSKAAVRPIACAQHVVVGHTTDRIVGLSADDGRMLWSVSRPLGERLRMDMPAALRLYADAYPDESAVFLASTYEVARLDPASGSLVWVASLEPGYWRPTVVDKRLLLVNTLDETLALDPTTGSQLWHRSGALGVPGRPPLFWAPGPGNLVRDQVVDADTGNLINTHRISRLVTDVGNSLISFTVDGMKLHDRQTLEPTGRIDVSGIRAFVTALSPYAIVATDRALVCVNVDQQRTEWIRELDIPARTFEKRLPAAIQDDNLFIGYKDTVYQLDLQTGETVATYRVPGAARRLVVCDAGIVVAAGKQWIGPRAVTVALDVE